MKGNHKQIITTLTAAISSIKAASNIAKMIKDGTSMLEKAELNSQIVEIMCSLSDARTALADANDLVREKENKIQELSEKLSFKGRLVHHMEAYYEVDSEGKPTGAPYCMSCWESKKLAVHLYHVRVFGFCPNCKNKYQHSKAHVID